MKQIQLNGKRGYHLDGVADPLLVEKGYCHYSTEGKKDFLDHITAYESQTHGIRFMTDTFRGNTAEVQISFVSDTAFRFTMLPKGVTWCSNAVFDFPGKGQPQIEETETFVIVRSGRLELQFRKLPWEMRVTLDGAPLTMEQIKDHNVDQKYKAVPIGFSVDENGKILNAYETMYMYSDEFFYGFGEKFTGFNKRGQKVTVWQRDAQSTNSDISYKGMPYFMSTTGYSIALNTYTRTHFNMGASSGVSYTMETEDPYLDYYMICNRDYKGLIRDYTALSGRSDMIPKWTFGFWMSKMSYMSREEVEQTVDKMERFGMSVDVIHIDGWGDSWENGDTELLSFDEKRFPDPEGMIQGLLKKGIHLSLWMFPYVNTVARNGEPSKHFLRMKERGFLVKQSDGEVYTFSPGEGDATGFVAALDFTNPNLVAYMKERVKRLMHMGVGVIKTDFSEEIPENAVFYDGTTGKESHNKYTLLYAKTIYEASKEAKTEMGQKALLWGRSGYLGSQNYPANWAGDSSASKNNLACLLNGGLSMGISGVSFWGFDIGGFYNCDYEGNRVIPKDEEYIRSVQMGLMSPLSRSHGQSTPREPWVFSKTAQNAFLKVNKLRYRLLPYLYSTAYETHNEGIPMMRAMMLEYPEDQTTFHLGSQYMLGSAMLVAPVFDQQRHHVYLPEGSWIELETGGRISGGKWLEVPQKIDVIPLYLRENRALFLLKEAPMHIADTQFTDIEVVMNLTDTMSQAYYDDGIDGRITACLAEDCVEITLERVQVATIKIYTDRCLRGAVVNGQKWNVVKGEHFFLVCQEV